MSWKLVIAGPQADWNESVARLSQESVRSPTFAGPVIAPSGPPANRFATVTDPLMPARGPRLAARRRLANGGARRRGGRRPAAADALALLVVVGQARGSPSPSSAASSGRVWQAAHRPGVAGLRRRRAAAGRRPRRAAAPGSRRAALLRGAAQLADQVERLLQRADQVALLQARALGDVGQVVAFGPGQRHAVEVDRQRPRHLQARDALLRAGRRRGARRGSRAGGAGAASAAGRGRLTRGPWRTTRAPRRSRAARAPRAAGW